MSTRTRSAAHLPVSELITAGEAVALGMHSATLAKLRNTGHVAHYRLANGTPLYSRADVETEIAILDAIRPNRKEAGWFYDGRDRSSWRRRSSNKTSAETEAPANCVAMSAAESNT